MFYVLVLFQRFFYRMLPYFAPFIVTSILTGVWGLQIIARMVSRYLPDHKIMHKYFAIQLVLFIYRFQPIAIRVGLNVIDMIFGLRIQSKIIENGKKKNVCFRALLFWTLGF